MSDAGSDLTTAEREATSTALAAGITVLGAGLGIFGGLTGTVARMVRNDLGFILGGGSLIVVAIGFAVASRVLASTRPRRSAQAFWTGGASLVIGLGLAVGGAMHTISRDDRPNVNAMVTETATSTTVSGTATVGGLDADQPLYVRVYDGDHLAYESLAGANEDGQVVHEFAVLIDDVVGKVVVVASRVPGIENCPTEEDSDKAREQTSCAVLDGF